MATNIYGEKMMEVIDWGKVSGLDPASPGGDRTVISLTPGPGSTTAGVADAVRALELKYPGAEIHVRGFDGASWQRNA